MALDATPSDICVVSKHPLRSIVRFDTTINGLSPEQFGIARKCILNDEIEVVRWQDSYETDEP